jgi:predicted ester cyclase
VGSVTSGHESLVLRWYEDLFNAKNLTALDEIAAPACVLHLPGGGAAESGQAIRGVFEWYHSTFADVHWTIQQIVAADEWVTVRASGTGRYVGDWHGIPSSGQPIAETSINLFRIEAGRIAEVWFEVSDLDVARQLGAFPP